MQLSKTPFADKGENMRKQYWKHFAAAIAALSAAATLLTVLFDFEWLKSCWLYGIIGTALVVGGSHLYAKWQIRTKKSIHLSLSSHLKLTIKEGDLFEQKGVICIPFNEYFDTHLGDGVVGEKTLHGLFINKFFRDKIQVLDNTIKEVLLTETPVETIAKRRFDGCPINKYELGTCVDVNVEGNTYVLFALTHFDENDVAGLSRAEYGLVVKRLTEHLSKICESRAVYMPLFGTGLARMHRTHQRILTHLVDILDFDDQCSISAGVHIVIKSLDDSNVNLSALEEIIKKGIIETE